MDALPTGLLVLTLAVALLPMAAAQGAAPAPVPERLVVSFHGSPSAQAHGKYLGAQVLSVDAQARMAVVQASNGADFRQQASHQPDVRAVEPDAVAHAAMMPNDPEFGVSQYGPQLIGAPTAWDTTLGANTTVCMIDTGIRMTHQDLAGAYIGGTDLVNNDSDPTDDNGHGTHVAGIAAARTGNGVGIAGIAQSRLLIVKALDATGNGYLSNVATGITWCADHGAQVISMSLGSTSGLTALSDAVDYAWAHGAVLVAAAGNGGCTNCVQYPAKYTNVIAVGCIDQNKAVCSFTSQGPEVDLAAPGNAIQSTWDTSDIALMRAAGTSMSAPHVAGAAALVWAAHPGYTNAQVRAALEGSAQDVGAAGQDAATGHGLVRADLALLANVSAVQAPPPAPVHALSFTPASQSATIAGKASITYTTQLHNSGNVAETVTLSLSANRSGWGTSMSQTSLTIQAGATANVTFMVTAPAKSQPMTATLTAAGAVQAQATALTTIGK